MTNSAASVTPAPVNAFPPSAYLSIQKAFRILELLAAHSPRGVTEIATELDIQKSSVSRLLKGLAELGYTVQSSSRGQYQLSPRILVLAQRYLEGDRLVKEGQPILQELAMAVRASAHLAVLVGKDLVILAKETSPERIQVSTRVGGGTPLHASALGKVLLASVPEKDCAALLMSPLPRFTDKTVTDPEMLLRSVAEVRQQGYALEAEEEHPGVGCIGAPVRDATGRWIAAISVAGPLHGTPFKLDLPHRRLVIDKAAELSHRLGLPKPDIRA